MKETAFDEKFQHWIARICVVSIVLWVGYFFVFLVHQSIYGAPIPQNWFLQIIQKHSAATVGIGISAISSFFLVAVLQFTVGRIVFEALGFKFEGAAGQVVLWILCFLAMIFATWLLWDKG